MTRYIDAHRTRFGIEPICRTLQVAPSTYYAARQRSSSARCRRDAELTTQLRQVHAAHFACTACASSGGNCSEKARRSLGAQWSG
jgi:putative transposase